LGTSDKIGTFATAFPPHLSNVSTLPCEVDNSVWDI